MCDVTCVQMSMEARRGHQRPVDRQLCDTRHGRWDRGLEINSCVTPDMDAGTEAWRQWCDTQHGCWKLTSGPLGEHHVLLTSEPHRVCFCAF